MLKLSPRGLSRLAGRCSLSTRFGITGASLWWAGAVVLASLGLALPAAAETGGSAARGFPFQRTPEPVPVRVEGEPVSTAAPEPEVQPGPPRQEAVAPSGDAAMLQADNAALRAKVAELERALAEARRSMETLQAKLDAILTVPQPEDTEKLRVYRVREGDTLYTIAQRPEVYSDGRLWKRILEANRHTLPDPNRLQPGQQLVIPR